MKLLKEKKQKKDSKKIPYKDKRKRRTVQNSIAYEMMIKDGICCLGDGRYSKSVHFSDINYQQVPDSEKRNLFSNYVEVLNALANEEGMIITIHNHILDYDELERDVLYAYEKDGYDHYRDEMNDMLLKSLTVGNNQLVQDKTITYVVKESDYKAAAKSLSIIDKEVSENINTFGCETEIMDGIQRLKFLSSIFDPEKKLFFDYDQIGKYYNTKDAIAPTSLDFKKDYFIAGNRYCSVLFLKNYATEMSDKLLYLLTTLEHNLTISFHMKAYPRGSDLDLIKSKLGSMEMQKQEENRKAFKNMYDPSLLPRNLTASLESATDLLNMVQEDNQRLFDCQLLVMVNAESKEKMDEAIKAVTTTCKKISCEIAPLDYQQEDGMNAILPIGCRVPTLSRTLPTPSCAILMPFTSQELTQKKDGIYYGQNSITNNLILADRKQLQNPTGWRLGKPGGGKSFSSKQEITSVFLKNPNDDIVIIDPQNEYTLLANDFHGTVINMDINSGLKLNPFEGDIHEKNFITEKTKFAHVIIAEIVGGGTLTANQKSLTDRCVRKMYEEYTAKLNDITSSIKPPAPTLGTFASILERQSEKEAADMTTALEMYVTGSYSLFNGESNVNMNNRFTTYNLLELDDLLRPLAMKVILESLKNRILSNFKKGKWTWIFIDEIYLMLKDAYSENFLYEFFKWARKFGAIVTGITQNVEDVLKSEKVRTMMANAEFFIMLPQAETDLIQLESLFALSSSQSKYLKRAKKGSGLIKFGKTLITYSNEFPKDTDLYNLWSTSFSEKSKPGVI